MNQPTVSVIIPVYNTGASAKTLIESLLRDQTYQNLEIIVVDDGSTDDSLKLLKSISDEKSRLRVFHQKNAGASSARNLGLKHISGEFVAFIDSDDKVSPDYLEKLIAASRDSSVALAVSAFLYHRVRENTEFPVYDRPLPPKKPSETYKSYILRLLLSDGRLYAVINKLFRAEIIKKHHLTFDPAKNFAEDLKFVLDYLAAKEGKIEFILEPLYVYYYGSPTSTVVASSLAWENWETSFADVKTWLGSNPNGEERRRLRNLRRRWKISHALAVARSNKPFKEKLDYLNLFALLPASLLVKLRR